MKRTYFFLIVPFAVLLATGCNKDDESAAKPSIPTPSDVDRWADEVVDEVVSSAGEQKTESEVAKKTESEIVKETEPAVDDSSESAPTEVVVAKLDAEDVLKQAVADAKTQNKVVFVHLGAPW